MRLFSLRRLLLLGLGILFLLQLFSLGAVWYLFRYQDDLVRLVNLAGRQRMLTQRMTKELYEFVRNPSSRNAERLEESIALYERNLRMVQRDPLVQKEKAAQEALRRNLALWNRFKGELRVLEKLSPQDPSFEEHLRFIRENNERLLKASDQVVKVIEGVAQRSKRYLESALMVAMVVFVALLIAIFLFTRRTIIRPLSEITEVFRHLGAGDLRVEIPRARLEEVRVLAEAARGLSNFISRTLQAVKVQSELQGVSEGVVRSSGESLSSGAEELQRFSEDIARAIVSTRESVEEVTRAAQELNQAINEISQSVSRTAQATGEAREKAELTDQVVKSLGDQAREIGSIVEVIRTIADQTNLLALNATIEAARAGEAGKGFAVVANEVKELARQTAEATERITETIRRIQEGVEQAVSATDEITRTVVELNEHANTIASAVEEQTAVVSQISGSLERVVSEVEGLSQQSERLTGTAATFSDLSTELNFTLKGVKESVEELERINQLFQVKEGGLEIKGLPCALALQEAVLAHIMWRCRVIEAVLRNEVPQVERDPTRCYLGRVLAVWRPRDPEIAALVERVQDPHRKLHSLVDEYEQFLRECGAGCAMERRLQWLEEKLYPVFAEVIGLLFEVLERCRRKYIAGEDEII